MQMLVIVVTEKTANGWSAWFRNSPQNVCVADSDVIAMLNLVEVFGTREMDFWDMTKLDARSRDNHYEFLIPSAVPDSIQYQHSESE